MKREYLIVLTIAALVVGVLVGYGVWGTGPSDAAELRSKVAELTQQNAGLKAKLEALGVPAAEIPGSNALFPAGPPEEKK